MIQTITPQQWVEKYVDLDKLQESVIASMIDAIRNDYTEEDNYIAIVHDIVNGANGIYTPYYALQYFDYELNTNNIEQYDTESTYWELEHFSGAVANILNKQLPNDINVQFGHWETDGTYCLLAYLDKDEYENNKDESFSFIGEAFGEI